MKSLTASLRLERTGRQRRPREGEREDRRGTGRVYCWADPCQSGRQQEGGVRKQGTAAVSFNEHSLLSSAFNLQACPALRPIHPHTHLKGTQAAGDSQKTFTRN